MMPLNKLNTMIAGARQYVAPSGRRLLSRAFHSVAVPVNAIVAAVPQAALDRAG